MDSDEDGFGSFRATHPDLWQAIGLAWTARGDGPVSDAFYRGMRFSVSIVGRFPSAIIDAECERVFG